MNSKQLANVLIKILGLSICIHGFPASIVAIVSGGAALIHAMQNGHQAGAAIPYWAYSLNYLVQSVVEFAAGIFLIIRSRWVTDILFKDEAE
jgi:hydrogenase/urease accessory protein HupE